MMTKQKKRIGIALEGGGAKGSFQVGAIRAIREMNIAYSGVVGASIGAINGALIAMNDISLMESVWLSTKVNDIIAGDEELLKKIVKLDFKGDLTEVRQILLDTIKQGGLDITPYKAYLKEFINEECIRKSEIEYGLVTLSLTDLKPIEIFVRDIPSGKLTEYIMASANFPAFKMGKIDNKVFLDGGFFDNLPINMLLEEGYDEVIAIRIMGMGRIRKIPKVYESKVTVILPSEDLGRTLEIDPIRAKHNMLLGYFDTYKVLHKLLGTYFYITETLEEDEAFARFSEIPDPFCEQIMLDLGLGVLPKKRFIFEHFIPLLGDVLKLPKQATYTEILLAFYETLGKYAGIERLKFYTLNSLMENVNSHYQKIQLETDVKIDKMSLSLLNIIKSVGISVMPQKQRREFLEFLLLKLIQTDDFKWDQ